MNDNLLTGCPACDVHGPDEYPPLTLSLNLDEWRAVHRTWHELSRALAPPVDRLARFFDRHTHPNA